MARSHGVVRSWSLFFCDPNGVVLKHQHLGVNRLIEPINPISKFREKRRCHVTTWNRLWGTTMLTITVDLGAQVYETPFGSRMDYDGVLVTHHHIHVTGGTVRVFVAMGTNYITYTLLLFILYYLYTLKKIFTSNASAYACVRGWCTW